MDALFDLVTGTNKEESTLSDKLNLLYNGFETPEEIAGFIFSRTLDREEIVDLLCWRDADGRALLDAPERLKVFFPLLNRLSDEQIKEQFEGKDYHELPVSVRALVSERRGKRGKRSLR